MNVTTVESTRSIPNRVVMFVATPDDYSAIEQAVEAQTGRKPENAYAYTPATHPAWHYLYVEVT